MSPSLNVTPRYRTEAFFPNGPIRAESLAVTKADFGYDYDENRPLTRLNA